MKVVLLDSDVKLPTRANATDSGWDVCFHNVKKIYSSPIGASEIIFTEKIEKTEKSKRLIPVAELDRPSNTRNISQRLDGDRLELFPGDRAFLGTGIIATAGLGNEIQVRSRSGLGSKEGLVVCQGIGTIDESYRGEIIVVLFNLSKLTRYITIGDRIAQLVVCPVVLDEIEVVDELDVTLRDENGFGSTGKK